MLHKLTTLDNLALIPNKDIQYFAITEESSAQSKLINIRGMVDVMNSIVKEAVHYLPPEAQRQEWDDAGMVTSLPYFSQLPLPWEKNQFTKFLNSGFLRKI